TQKRAGRPRPLYPPSTIPPHGDLTLGRYGRVIESGDESQSMFVEHAEPGEATSQERRNGKQSDSRVLGHVIHCDGAHATLAAFACDQQAQVLGQWTVGRMISINLGSIRTVG